MRIDDTAEICLKIILNVKFLILSVFNMCVSFQFWKQNMLRKNINVNILYKLKPEEGRLESGNAEEVGGG